MRAVVCGANGAVGQLLCQKLGADLVGRVSLDGQLGAAKTFADLPPVEADVVIDFSHHSAVADVLAYAKAHALGAVIGTTGHTPEEKTLIYETAK